MNLKEMKRSTVRVCDPFCIECNGTGNIQGLPPGACICVTYVSPDKVDDLMWSAVKG